MVVIYNQPRQGSTTPNEAHSPDDFELAALAAINDEKEDWDEREVQITDKVSYIMQNVIEQARKYYLGVFDTPTDEITGEPKTWVPQTETAVDQSANSIDLDTKDIIIMPGNPASVNITPVIRAAVQNLFKKLDFGQMLNDLGTAVSRDGTVVIKTVIQKNPHTGKKEISSYIVDLLNLWMDPHANTLEDTSVIERSVMSKFDVESKSDVWENTDKIQFSNTVPKFDELFTTSTGGKLPNAEMWERWGKIKKSWITKKKSDDDIWLEGHLIGSGIGAANVLHLARENPREDGRKPYEEGWYRRIPGRWYGRGVAEMLFGLQEYINMVVNIRKANNMVLQSGIFLIKKGSPVTPDMISQLSAGGGIPVNNVETDIKQLPVQDFRASSYQDEDRINLWGQRQTGAFGTGRGEVGAASQSATAALTAERNIRDTFVTIQENVGFLIERLIRNQYLPRLKEIMKPNELIRLTGDAEFLTFIDERLIKQRQNTFAHRHLAVTGMWPEPEQLAEIGNEFKDFLTEQGKQRFVKYFRGMFDENIDVEVHVTDEKFNRVVAVNQLRDALVAYSRIPTASKLDTDAILREMFNIMGLKGEFFMAKPQIPATARDIGQTARQLREFGEAPPTEVGAFTAAQGLPNQGPGEGLVPPKQSLNIGGNLANLQ